MALDNFIEIRQRCGERFKKPNQHTILSFWSKLIICVQLITWIQNRFFQLITGSKVICISRWLAFNVTYLKLFVWFQFGLLRINVREDWFSFKKLGLSNVHSCREFYRNDSYSSSKSRAVRGELWCRWKYPHQRSWGKHDF